MSKVVMIFFAAAALVQIIRPLGWPGLKRRRDAWKLAAAGFVAAALFIAIVPGS